MKVIDEKGKLFGKLNIIDLVVIVLIIAAVAVVGVKLLGGSGGIASTETKLTYTVRVTAQNENIADFVAEYVDSATGKSDQLLAGGGLLNAYVVDFWTEPTSYNVTNTYSVEVYDQQAAEAAGLIDLCFVIETTVSNTVINEVGTQEVRVGRNHIVKTAHMEFDNGVVENCTWETVE